MPNAEPTKSCPCCGANWPLTHTFDTTKVMDATDIFGAGRGATPYELRVCVMKKGRQPGGSYVTDVSKMGFPPDMPIKDRKGKVVGFAKSFEYLEDEVWATVVVSDPKVISELLVKDRVDNRRD